MAVNIKKDLVQDKYMHHTRLNLSLHTQTIGLVNNFAHFSKYFPGFIKKKKGVSEGHSNTMLGHTN